MTARKTKCGGLSTTRWTIRLSIAPAEMTHIRIERKKKRKELGKDDARAVGGFVFYSLEGFVGVVEGECLDLGFDAYFGG
jgi:hypothetical protein